MRVPDIDLDAPRCPYCLRGAPIVYRAVDAPYAHDWTVGGYFRIWPNGEWVVSTRCCGGRWGKDNPLPRFRTLREMLPEDVLVVLAAYDAMVAVEVLRILECR